MTDHVTLKFSNKWGHFKFGINNSTTNLYSMPVIPVIPIYSTFHPTHPHDHSMTGTAGHFGAQTTNEWIRTPGCLCPDEPSASGQRQPITFVPRTLGAQVTRKCAPSAPIWLVESVPIWLVVPQKWSVIVRAIKFWSVIVKCPLSWSIRNLRRRFLENKRIPRKLKENNRLGPIWTHHTSTLTLNNT